MSVVAVPRPAGLVAWVGSTDHKRVGLLTAATALVWLLVSGALALLVRAELTLPGSQVLGANAYDQAFTMHGTGMVFLVVAPIAIALGVYLVPLQVGAAELAAPRLALLGFWLYALGGGIAFLGFATAGGAGRAGWTGYPPLSTMPYTQGSGQDLWLLGVGLASLGPLLQAACVLWTALRLRAPGMTMLRVPVFTWTMVVTCLMVLTAFPALLGALALVELDRRGLVSLDSAGWLLAYQQLFWFFGHPVVYVMFFPFLGAVAEVVAVFAGRPLLGYRGIVVSLIVFAGLSMSVWAHHMFTTGSVPNSYYSLTSTLLLVPAGLEYFALVGTLLLGRLRYPAAMLFALGFVLQFLLGGLSGIFVASPPLDYQVHDSQFVVAHIHYVLVGGSLFGLFAAICFWFPKATGAMLREPLAKAQFWLGVVGTNLAFFPQHVLGWEGMARRSADYPGRFEALNVVSTVGAGILALSVALLVVNVVVSLRRRIPAGDDPWGGHTLEWATTSPPPRHNVLRLPPIRSHTPLLDLREEARA